MFRKKLAILLLFVTYFSAEIVNVKNASASDSFSFIDEFEDVSYDKEDASKVYDPFEKVNRKIFVFNDVVDSYFFEHIALGYRKFVPKLFRASIRNFFNNLYTPVTIVNSIFQGNLDNSLASSSSFLINSTIGIGGIFDVASKKGVDHNEEDFGQTFAKYGMGRGAYLVLPFFGSSNTRDFSGLIIKKSIDPLSFNLFKVGGGFELIDYKTSLILNASMALDRRESLIEIIDDVRRDSFDPYSTVRSAYSQNRKFEVLK